MNRRPPQKCKQSSAADVCHRVMLAHTHTSVHTRCIYTQSYAYIHVHYSKYIYRIYVPIVTNYKHFSLYWWICYHVVIIHVVMPLILSLDNRVTQTDRFPSLLQPFQSPFRFSTCDTTAKWDQPQSQLAKHYKYL